MVHVGNSNPCHRCICSPLGVWFFVNMFANLCAFMCFPLVYIYLSWQLGNFWQLQNVVFNHIKSKNFFMVHKLKSITFFRSVSFRNCNQYLVSLWVLLILYYILRLPKCLFSLFQEDWILFVFLKRKFEQNSP